MPLPLILGIGAAVAGAAGVGSGIHGGLKMKEAKETMQSADSRHKRNVARFEAARDKTSKLMDEVGELELKILKSFEDFTLVFEKIQNKPNFKSIETDDFKLPENILQEIKNVSVGAGVLLGGLTGAAVGTAGGFAAAGAATAAVTALGTASTGTAIASLSGAAATNATLAALGGGAIAAGGGGMALGTAVLGGATLGVGLLVGGVIFNITGSKLSNKADEAWYQMMKAEDDINSVCAFFGELNEVAIEFRSALSLTRSAYMSHLAKLKTIVYFNNKRDWHDFTEQEKLLTENTVMLVATLYNMCKVKLVNEADKNEKTNEINRNGIENAIKNSELAISKVL